MGLRPHPRLRLPGRRNDCFNLLSLWPPLASFSDKQDLPEERYVVLKKKSSLILIILAALLLKPGTLIPVTTGSGPASDPVRPVPSLLDFIEVISGDAGDQIAGVYVEDLFALPVVQQPADQHGYVSPSPDTITQFGMAEDYGTIGLLAHNYAAGDLFFELEEGMEIILIFSDSSLERYRVSFTASYQALEPENPRSAFRDLTNQNILSAPDLFTQVYNNPGAVTFQTCIAHENSLSWGRYFVSAIPTDEYLASSVTTEVDFPGFVSW